MNESSLPADPPKADPAQAENGPCGHSNRQVLLDFGSDGVRAGILTGESLFRCHLSHVDLSPDSLVTVFEEGEFNTARGGIPIFCTLLDRLPFDAPISLPGLSPNRPRDLLAELLAKITAGLRAWWGPSLDELGILIPTYLIDPHKSILVKTAKSVHWRTVRLINKTTALGVYGLEDRPPGTYLLVILGHGPADVSVVQWQSNHLRPLMHSSYMSLSGGYLDHVLIRAALERVKSGYKVQIETPLFQKQDWLRLREQIEIVRRRLSTYQRVVLELPGSLTDGVPREVAFDRANWLRLLDDFADQFRKMVEECCHKADVKMENLQSCILSGGLLLQQSLVDKLQDRCDTLPLIACPHEAQVLGGCRWLAQEQDAPAETAPPEEQAASRALPSLEEIRLGSVPEPTQPKTPRDHLPRRADAIIERVRQLSSTGQIEAARAELDPLKQYVRVLELSLAPPDQALDALAEDRGEPSCRPMDSAPAPRQTGAAEADAKSDARPDDEKKKKEQGKKKAQRRRYLLAKDEIKKAQRALNVGQLEQAVRTSHSAFQRSADPRIFEAMIKVHLRAASKRPPQIKFFEEEKGWLLCALNDDGTNEEVQAALAGRYMRHVEQLVDLRTKEAHHAAVNSLKELRQYIPLPQLAASWLQELQKAKPGDARLTPGSAQPESP